MMLEDSFFLKCTKAPITQSESLVTAFKIPYDPRNRDVAQLVERTVRDRKAAGSSPVIPTIRFDPRCARISLMVLRFASGHSFLEVIESNDNDGVLQERDEVEQPSSNMAKGSSCCDNFLLLIYPEIHKLIILFKNKIYL